MKKFFILFLVLFSMLSPDLAMADRNEIPPQFLPDPNTNNNGGRDRAPMRIPLSIYYDTETNIVEVVGPESLQAQVTIRNEYNEIESVSYVLNSCHFISEPGMHTILIQGEGWTATGEFTIINNQ